MTTDSAPIGLPSTINPQWRIGIVHSLFYKEEVNALVASAREVLLEAGIAEANVSLHPAAGSFEIPLIGSILASSKSVSALIGLGVIVEGETHHAKLIAQNVARGIMDVQVNMHIPFAFEVLYVSSLEQAQSRLEKGGEAACAVLHSLAQCEAIG